MVLIILLGVVDAAAKILGVLPAVSPAEVLLLPTVLTIRLPGYGFFTGTTTLLQEIHTIYFIHTFTLLNYSNRVKYCRNSAEFTW